MENVPIYISILFMLTSCITVFIFYKATNHSKFTLAIILTWLIIHSILSLLGFYKITDTLPPRFIFTLAPPIIAIATLLFIPSGKRFIDNLQPQYLTLLHTIRVPVEFVLLGLFIHGAIPQIMTFEGRNLDIISGLTAPIIFYLGYIKKRLNNTVLLLWNFICLGLLINIVVIAILAAPFIFQQLAFDQPNIALLYFPFVWLPCCVVPLVLISHVAAIRQLLLTVGKSAPGMSIAV